MRRKTKGPSGNLTGLPNSGKRSGVLVIAFALLSAFGLGGTALAVDFNCEGCDLAAMHLQAEALGRGQHRIYSFSNDLAFKFTVRCEGEVPLAAPESRDFDTMQVPDRPAPPESGTLSRNGCPFGQGLAIETNPLDAAEQHAFDVANDFLRAYPQGQHGIAFEYTPLPGTDWGQSVYNVLNNHPGRVNLFNEIQQNAPVVPQYLNALAVGIGAYFNVLSNRMIIRVVFRDGSSFRIYFDGNLQTFHLIPDSALSETNQPIVEQNDRSYAGRYNIAGTDVGAYLRFLEGMGVEVVGTRGSHSTCSWDPKHSRLTCRIW